MANISRSKDKNKRDPRARTFFNSLKKQAERKNNRIPIQGEGGGMRLVYSLLLGIFYGLRWGKMRYNLIWYIPFFLFMFMRVVVENAIVGFKNLKMVFIDNFTFGLLISPSSALYLSTIFASILVPLQLLMLIPIFFDKELETYKRRYLWTFLVTIFAFPLATVFLQFVLWGSFPYGYDEDGAERLRLFPFFPWPKQPFWEQFR